MHCALTIGILCILPPCRWPHDWLKHVGGYCVYNYFHNTHVHCVGAIIVYTVSLYGSVTRQSEGREFTFIKNIFMQR